ncbi:hypothetical protein [Pseudomonas sp. L1(2025)]|uniref:hypothetical protein n=1 Tax=Pseudomonas sp. L1(2025) TaxID=3449429 RepID=UPI003F692B7C
MSNSSHEWSKDALFKKAQLYAETMIEHEDNAWQFGLWSAFTLEFLIRAAVSAVSPVLLADAKDWNNILYGLEIATNKPKFIPKSAATSELILRLEDIVPSFTREHANFCIAHLAKRNSEMHGGNLEFELYPSSAWAPMFYSVCKILSTAAGESLENLLGPASAKRANEDIAALKDVNAKSVRGAIEAHKTVWNEKSATEKSTAQKQAQTAALRHYGHRINCPACQSVALIQGKAAGEAKKSVSDDGVIEKQIMKPEAMHCIACGLKIAGYSKLLAAGLGSTYISTSQYDAMEYFSIDLDEHVRSMMEDDNNE